jgi:Domain of unknown function (DUF6916)
MLDTLKLEDFAPRIGERFRLSADAGQTIEVTLVEAAALGVAPGAQSARRAPFSLMFLGPARPVWPQRIYRLEHEAVGTLDVFFVPLGSRDGGMQYQAIFT